MSSGSLTIMLLRISINFITFSHFSNVDCSFRGSFFLPYNKIKTRRPLGKVIFRLFSRLFARAVAKAINRNAKLRDDVMLTPTNRALRQYLLQIDAG
jgi:hypothetical protein